MKPTKTLHQLHKQALEEVEVHRFVTEASSIGLRPGEIPAMIAPFEPFGNGQPFVWTAIDEDGSLTYTQDMGCVSIRIFND